MSNATYGVLLGLGWNSVVEPLARTQNGVNGLGTFKLFAWDFASARGGIGVARWRASDFWGNYKIAGTTQLSGVPVARWVYVYPQTAPSACVAAVYTDPATGAFEFDNLGAGNYIVLGVDPLGNQNAVVYDFVAAAPM